MEWSVFFSVASQHFHSADGKSFAEMIKGEKRWWQDKRTPEQMFLKKIQNQSKIHRLFIPFLSGLLSQIQRRRSSRISKGTFRVSSSYPCGFLFLEKSFQQYHQTSCLSFLISFQDEAPKKRSYQMINETIRLSLPHQFLSTSLLMFGDTFTILS